MPLLLAHYLIMTLYGHWPPNDPRGSGSLDFHDDKFADLGPIHQGRKPEHLQPSRDELRAYHRDVKPLLNFPIFWIDDATRQAIARAFADVIRRNGYTCYACAICSNHAHLVIRKHRDRYEEMFSALTGAAAELVRPMRNLAGNHPVFSQRPYSVFLNTPADIESRVDYVRKNPMKEGLPEQHFDFVTAYDGWPHPKR